MGVTSSDAIFPGQSPPSLKPCPLPQHTHTHIILPHQRRSVKNSVSTICQDIAWVVADA
jgi:hypothetical protein